LTGSQTTWIIDKKVNDKIEKKLKLKKIKDIVSLFIGAFTCSMFRQLEV
jgi:hypothetical protein